MTTIRRNLQTALLATLLCLAACGPERIDPVKESDVVDPPPVVKPPDHPPPGGRRLCSSLQLAPRLDWGRVAVGVSAVRMLGLGTNGATPCAVELEVAGAGFAVATPEVVLRPDRPAMAEIVFLPVAAGQAAGFLYVRGADGTRIVQLAAEGVLDCLSVDPPAIEFGEATILCDAARTLRIENGCNHFLPIEFEIEGSEFSADLPDEVAPASVATGTVFFHPMVPESRQGLLRLRAGTAAERIVPIVGVGVIGGVRWHVDRFEIPPLPKVDYLFVIDDSAATAAKLEALADALAYAQIFQAAELIDARWAVTTTSRIATPGCAGSGNGGALLPFGDEGTLWIDPRSSDLETVLAPFEQVPDCSTAPNEALAAVRVAAPAMQRPETTLTVVVVSARDDRSEESLETLRRALDLDADRLRIHAIAGPEGGCPGAEEGRRLLDFAGASNGVFASICEPEKWTEFFERVDAPFVHLFSPQRFSFPRRYLLRHMPIDLDHDGEIEDEIEVRVDGVVLPSRYGNEIAWRWDAIGNGIEFNPLYRPAPGSTFEVEYPTTDCPPID